MGGRWDTERVSYLSGIYDYLVPMPKDGWTVIDCGDRTVDHTVEKLLKHMGPG